MSVGGKRKYLIIILLFLFVFIINIHPVSALNPQDFAREKVSESYIAEKNEVKLKKINKTYPSIPKDFNLFKARISKKLPPIEAYVAVSPTNEAFDLEKEYNLLLNKSKVSITSNKTALSVVRTFIKTSQNKYFPNSKILKSYEGIPSKPNDTKKADQYQNIIKPPKVEKQNEKQIVTFYTWTRRNGLLAKWEVIIKKDKIFQTKWIVKDKFVGHFAPSIEGFSLPSGIKKKDIGKEKVFSKSKERFISLLSDEGSGSGGGGIISEGCSPKILSYPQYVRSGENTTIKWYNPCDINRTNLIYQTPSSEIKQTSFQEGDSGNYTANINMSEEGTWLFVAQSEVNGLDYYSDTHTFCAGTCVLTNDSFVDIKTNNSGNFSETAQIKIRGFEPESEINLTVVLYNYPVREKSINQTLENYLVTTNQSGDASVNFKPLADSHTGVGDIIAIQKSNHSINTTYTKSKGEPFIIENILEKETTDEVSYKIYYFTANFEWNKSKAKEFASDVGNGITNAYETEVNSWDFPYPDPDKVGHITISDGIHRYSAYFENGPRIAGTYCREGNDTNIGIASSLQEWVEPTDSFYSYRTQEGLIKSVTGHEHFHNLQYGINQWKFAGWWNGLALVEGTARFIETLIAPGANQQEGSLFYADNINGVNGYMESPNKPLDWFMYDYALYWAHIYQNNDKINTLRKIYFETKNVGNNIETDLPKAISNVLSDESGGLSNHTQSLRKFSSEVYTRNFTWEKGNWSKHLKKVDREQLHYSSENEAGYEYERLYPQALQFVNITPPSDEEYKVLFAGDPKSQFYLNLWKYKKTPLPGELEQKKIPLKEENMAIFTISKPSSWGDITFGTIRKGTSGSGFYSLQLFKPKEHDLGIYVPDWSVAKKPGKKIEVSPIVYNIGKHDETNVTIKFMAEEELISEKKIDLKKEEVRKIHFEWASTDGSDMKIYIEPIKGEKHTSNNKAEKLYWAIESRVLLVDDDGGKEYEDYYSDSIFGYFDYWEVSKKGSPSYEKLKKYDSVIWFTGDESYNTLTKFDRKSLKRYLDNGGNLFISGQDIGYDLVENGDSDSKSFYKNYLHANYEEDYTQSLYLEGVDWEISEHDDINISNDGGGANNQYYPSIITPSDKWAEGVFSYRRVNTSEDTTATTTTITSGGGGGGGGSIGPPPYGAIKANNGKHKVVYFSFGFEGINKEYLWEGPDNEISRDEVMENVLDYFGYEMVPPRTVITTPDENSKTGDNTALVATTNENAFCKYARENEEFERMNHVFDITGTTVHSTVLTNLTDGEHTYFVKCMDSGGNVNTPVNVTWTVDTDSYYNKTEVDTLVENNYTALASQVSIWIEENRTETISKVNTWIEGNKTQTISKVNTWIQGNRSEVLSTVDGWIESNITEVETQMDKILKRVSKPVITSVNTDTTQTSNPVLINITTDENAKCSWDKENIGYKYMEHEFARGQGTKRHTTNVTGREGINLFYVSCKDMEGNYWTSSATIAFNLDTSGNYNITEDLKKYWDYFWLPRMILENIGSLNKNYTVSNILHSIKGNYEIIYYYDGSSWKSYASHNTSFQRPTELNDLKKFNDQLNKPYWIYMYEGDRLEIK